MKTLIESRGLKLHFERNADTGRFRFLIESEGLIYDEADEMFHRLVNVVLETLLNRDAIEIDKQIESDDSPAM